MSKYYLLFSMLFLTIISPCSYGQGFSGSYFNWDTPSGGNFSAGGTPYGFLAPYGNSFGYNNCQNWSTMDMNGDNKPDLVVTAQFNSTGSYNEQFGVGTNPYWQVYLNTGNAFAATPINWNTPVGGNYSSGGTPYGYLAPYGTSFNYANCQNWGVVDMNDDNMPDLVVTSQYNSAGTYNEQFGAGSSPYWKVYLNTGTGFSLSPLNWNTPIGGNYSSVGTPYGYLTLSGNSYGYTNCQHWSIADMDGDHKPDLVVTAQYNSVGTYNEQFGAGSSPYWKVYQNNGSGFSSTAQTWSTPVGGNYSNSAVAYGYLNMSGISYGYPDCEN